MNATTTQSAVSGTKGVPGFVQELADLQKDSLRIIAVFALCVGYAGLFCLLWLTIDLVFAAACGWVGVGLLITGALTAQRFRDQRLKLATYLLIGSVLGGAAGLIYAFPSRDGVYVFILPIVFAGVLLSRPAFLAVAGLVEGLAVCLLTLIIGLPLLSAPVLLPVLIIAAVTAISWFSVHNLHTMLAWALMGYETARRGEGVARDRQAELRRALKALDEATHRIERANHMLALARDQAEEARRLKQQFAQTISHELRTPLNLIVGFTELMTESPEYYGGTLLPSYQRDLNIVYRNARHLQALVNDVLDLARIDAVQMTMTLETVAPGSLVQEAVNTVRSLVESRGLALRVDVQLELPLLRVDPTRIRQVLINLLNNAARFTEQGEIVVRARNDGDGVIFSVVDTGVGISARDIPHIFEEFRQADGSTRRSHEGAGLGLAISQRFVRLHGGRIWVESQVGRGSTFSFRLPISAADAVVVSELQMTATSSVPMLPRGETVMLTVTPSTAAAHLLTHSLHEVRTVVVPDLDQARRAVRAVVPQIVLIDQACCSTDLAEVDALGVALASPEVPFIVCPLPDEKGLRRQFSVDGYLAKPISAQLLWDVLRRFGDEVDTIMIVDDDGDFVRLVTRMLEDNPVRRYRAVEAYSGQEALNLLELYKPDLVLLDLELPDLHGFQVVEIMRSNVAWRDIPIITVTGQEVLDAQRPLMGRFVVTRPEGLVPREIVRLVRSVVDLSVTSPPAPPELTQEQAR